MKKEKQKKRRQKSLDAIKLGRDGGKATFKKLGKEHMSDIGKEGAKARWGK